MRLSSTILVLSLTVQTVFTAPLKAESDISVPKSLDQKHLEFVSKPERRVNERGVSELEEEEDEINPVDEQDEDEFSGGLEVNDLNQKPEVYDPKDDVESPPELVEGLTKENGYPAEDFESVDLVDNANWGDDESTQELRSTGDLARIQHSLRGIFYDMQKYKTPDSFNFEKFDEESPKYTRDFARFKSSSSPEILEAHQKEFDFVGHTLATLMMYSDLWKVYGTQRRIDYMRIKQVILVGINALFLFDEEGDPATEMSVHEKKIEELKGDIAEIEGRFKKLKRVSKTVSEDFYTEVERVEQVFGLAPDRSELQHW